VSSHTTLYSKRHGGPVTHIAWQQQQQTVEPCLTLLSLGGEGCLLSWPAIAPGTGSSSRAQQPSDAGAQLQGWLARGQQGVVGVGREVLLWCCMAVSACGGRMAVCSTRGHVAMLTSSSSSSSSSSGIGGGGSSGSSQWRRGADDASRVVPWQLTASCRTPWGLPVKAAAWQPHTPPSTAGVPADTAAAAAAAAAVSEALGTAAHSWCALLAAVDEQNLYLFNSSSSSSSSSSDPGHKEAVASCSVQAAQQQQQQQQQLLSLAWSAPDVLCVGCSDGSIQVVKVSSSVAHAAPHRPLQP
jgi:hypothetical protein